MFSAGGYPIVLYGAWDLPPILPQGSILCAGLCQLHPLLACLLMATSVAHMGAAIFHGLIRRNAALASSNCLPWGNDATLALDHLADK
jgi:cytochrome b561